jgi:hypothetical protein
MQCNKIQIHDVVEKPAQMPKNSGPNTGPYASLGLRKTLTARCHQKCQNKHRPS